MSGLRTFFLIFNGQGTCKRGASVRIIGLIVNDWNHLVTPLAFQIANAGALCKIGYTSYCFKAVSIAAITSGESGFTAGSKRARILPSRETRNFVKFHLISPPVVGLVAFSVR